MTVTSKPLVIAKYDEKWPRFFHIEAERIIRSMGSEAIAIHHIGSTSVPGLSAKPIIDIILETDDFEKARLHLTNSDLGYHYQGEYNLPLRDLYSKNGIYKINLHVHQLGSSEITLNLLFRDFLRLHSDIRKQYENVKILASQSSKALEKVETGITQYNLMKNDMIVSILQKTGFDGLCVRFATHNTELEAFKKFKSYFFKKIHENDHIKIISKETKKFIIYKGTEIIGAAEISNLDNGRISIDFSTSKTKEGFLMLLNIIESWAKIRMHTNSLLAVVSKKQHNLYMSAGFTISSGIDGVAKTNLFKKTI